jgi:hypothetical protein
MFTRRSWMGLIALAVLMITVGTAKANTIVFSGTFVDDDQVEVFRFMSAGTGSVDVTTSGYAAGGFLPVLTIFDSAGNYWFNASDDQAQNSDVSVRWLAQAGEYWYVALSQFGNFHDGITPLPLTSTPDNWGNNFTMKGQPTFTSTDGACGNPAQLQFCGGPLRDLPRSGYWELSLTSPSIQATQETPEPGSIYLSVGGMAILLGSLRVRRSRSLKQVERN